MNFFTWRPRFVSFSKPTQADILYSCASGMRLDLYLPCRPPPYVPLLLIHGGGWASRLKEDMHVIAKFLQEAGMAVVNISYRLAPDPIYPAQIEDCLEALDWIRNHASKYNLDIERIGAMGYSAGAHLAAFVALLQTPAQRQRAGLTAPWVKKSYPAIKAVVAGGAPLDLTVYRRSPIVRRFLGRTYQEDPKLYERASPIFYITPNSPPFFLYHGKRDQLVEIEQMYKMETALKSAGIAVETHESRHGHVASFVFNRKAIQQSIDFLKRKLRV